MTLKNKGLFFVLVMLATVLVSYRFWWSPADQMVKPENTESNRPKLDPLTIMERLSTPVTLTEEQIREDQRMEAEQVADALGWLKSEDGQKRLEGAEQLSAYPTPEAGEALVKTLGKDRSAEVRTAAALSLAHFEQPGDAMVKSLLAALREDPAGEVREAALSTLEIYLEILDPESAQSRQIIKALGKLAKSRGLDPAIRASLEDLLVKW